MRVGKNRREEGVERDKMDEVVRRARRVEVSKRRKE